MRPAPKRSRARRFLAHFSRVARCRLEDQKRAVVGRSILFDHLVHAQEFDVYLGWLNLSGPEMVGCPNPNSDDLIPGIADLLAKNRVVRAN